MNSNGQTPPNPLFDAASAKTTGGSSGNAEKNDESKEALGLIRGKISALYGHEPDAREEAGEAKAVKHRSKHQQFMYELSTSGKPLAEIQSAWHKYYLELSDAEKHEVWREFYANHDRLSKPNRLRPAPNHHSASQPVQAAAQTAPAAKPMTTTDIKQQILGRVNKRASKKYKHHLKSVGFGLSMGFITLAIFMFGFFNERFIAPFYTPSRTVTSTPIITDATAAVGKESKIIIPKINVEIPVVYDEPTINEAAIQRALERGVVHYPTTANPGEQGNAVIFGHSSNNILNSGKYKFAFVLLNRLEVGDTFMLEKDGQRYIYKVSGKKVVPPTDVSVLSDLDRPTATLITCDPPGTSLNRLIVVGDQISPDPAKNIASTAKTASAEPTILPSNSQTLWDRFWSWISS